MMTKFLPTLMLVVLLGSCTIKRDAPSIFSDQACRNPCWNNIVVGQTDKQEFLRIISTLPNVDQASINSRTSSGDLFDEEIIFNFYRLAGKKNSLVRMAAEISEEKVAGLIFIGKSGLTSQELFDMLGSPDFATTLRTQDGGINVHVINSTQGVEVVQYFKSEKSTISPDTEINYLFLFDPSQYQTYLKSNLLTPDHNSFILYPWTGYGKIEDLYWPPK